MISSAMFTGDWQMFQLLKKTLFCLSRKTAAIQPNFDEYPLYYMENGMLIRENSDGAKFEVVLDGKKSEKIVRRIK